MHSMVFPVGAHPAQLGSQHLQAALFLKSLGLCRITLRQLGLAARPTLLRGEGVVGRRLGSLFDGGDTRAQPDDVSVLTIASQTILGVIAGDDRVGPPRTGPRS